MNVQHLLNTSYGQSVVGSARRWHRLQVISCGTARDCGRSLCPRSHLPTHPHSLAGEDRGCRCLAPGMPKCQLRGFGSRNLFFNPRPAVTKTKAESLFLKLTSQGNKIASPPRVHSRRQKAWLYGMPPAGNDPLCASAETAT